MVRAFISERRWQRGKTGPSHEYTIGGWVRGLRDHQRLIAVAYPFCLTGNVREPRRWRVPRPNSNGSFTCGTESNCQHRKSLGTAFGTVRLPVTVRSLHRRAAVRRRTVPQIAAHGAVDLTARPSARRSKALRGMSNEYRLVIWSPCGYRHSYSTKPTRQTGTHHLPDYRHESFT